MSKTYKKYIKYQFKPRRQYEGLFYFSVIIVLIIILLSYCT